MAEKGVGVNEAVTMPDKFAPRRREFAGFWSYVVSTICVASVIYHLFYAYYHPFFAMPHRAIHLLFMISLVFLLYPLWKRKSPRLKPSILDITLWLTSTGILLWIAINAGDILLRLGSEITIDIIVGGIVIIFVLEATRRSVSYIIPVICTLFLLYALLGNYLPGFLDHPPLDPKMLATSLGLSTKGIYGIPLGVSANFIFLFILYGAILRYSGGGRFLTDLSFALTGGMVGGPAKAAVVGSTFFGMISGSSVANTTTTGTITIPLMKKAGFASHFAGAVEASASTIGQIMPPVMGAAAFIMAEFLGIPYLDICKAAVIPASLAFLAVFMQVHFKAKTMGLKPEPKTISLRKTLASGWIHFISVIVLVTILVMRYSPERAVTLAIITQMVVTLIRKDTRMSPKVMLLACREGAIGAIDVAIACAAIGLIIGSITGTGLGLKFSAIIADVSRGSVFIALPMAGLASLILGTGVPTTAQYIIIAALVCPALVNLGVLAIAAHLFIFYWGTRADITPPVALAAYAGAAIAKSDPMKTGFTAFQLGMAGYIIPFIFVFNTGLLMIGSSSSIILTILVSFVAVICLAAAVQNYLLIRTTLLERLLLFAIPAICCFPIGMKTLLIIPLSGVILTSQKFRQKKEKEV